MITHTPPIDPDRTPVETRVSRVTVLEDRALVSRTGTLSLDAGAHRLVVVGLAPVLQDVSLRASSSRGDVTDVRAHRALRIRTADRPEDIARIETRLRELSRDLGHARDDGERARERLSDVARMLALGAREIPEDAAWGVVDPSQWSGIFDDLFTRSRELVDTALSARFRQEDVVREATELERQRQALASIEQDLAVWAAIDLELDASGPVELTLEYVVPNALWRPLHRAELLDGRLRMTARAAIWQATGESWDDVEIALSTAQGSLGTTPPTLADDLLSAQRKAEQVTLEAREVAVQKTGPTGGGGRPSNKVDLPGVDDGGEVQDLRPTGTVTVPDRGEPVFVDLFGFESPAEVERVAMPEIDDAVHLAVRADHTGDRPLLAGPVELVRDHGPVGTTASLYVAPGSRLQLGFGPDDDLRVHRDQRIREDETDPIDKWEHRDSEVSLFVSNLGPEPRELTLTERIPVSEVDHVKVSIDTERTTPGGVLDEEHGFVRWSLTIPAHGTETVTLDWRLSVAPGAVLA